MRETVGKKKKNSATHCTVLINMKKTEAQKKNRKYWINEETTILNRIVRRDLMLRVTSDKGS